MSEEFVVEIATKTIYYTMLLSAPILITGLVVGVLVSLFQAVTQIREMTLTFIPKIAAVLLVLIITIPWLLHRFQEYVDYIMNIIQNLNH